MNNQTTKIKDRIVSKDTLHIILEELRLLRNEIALLLPQEDLEDYAHPERIRRSFQKAIKKHPVVWK